MKRNNKHSNNIKIKKKKTEIENKVFILKNGKLWIRSLFFLINRNIYLAEKSYSKNYPNIHGF